MKPVVIIESPYAGDVLANEAYAKRALLDSLNRGEAPFASHLLYTQVLNDRLNEERIMGMSAGLAFTPKADYVAVYKDRGISDGMRRGIDHARSHGIPVIYRSLDQGSNQDV